MAVPSPFDWEALNAGMVHAGYALHLFRVASGSSHLKKTRNCSQEAAMIRGLKEGVPSDYPAVTSPSLGRGYKCSPEFRSNLQCIAASLAQKQLNPGQLQNAKVLGVRRADWHRPVLISHPHIDLHSQAALSASCQRP